MYLRNIQGEHENGSGPKQVFKGRRCRARERRPRPRYRLATSNCTRVNIENSRGPKGARGDGSCRNQESLKTFETVAERKIFRP